MTELQNQLEFTPTVPVAKMTWTVWRRVMCCCKALILFSKFLLVNGTGVSLNHQLDAFCTHHSHSDIQKDVATIVEWAVGTTIAPLVELELD